ncbi:MAG: MFS transporter, partial [Chloroflexi bacterium]|nr:MFS transporter [Chloroflexota bacterium]
MALRTIRTFESLGIQGFRYLWLGQVSTGMGQWMDQVSRTWLIYSMTHSPMQLGLVSAARGVPMLFLGVIAGVAADRYGRKTQLIVAQAVNAFLNLLLAVMVVTGTVELWHIYVTAVMAGTVHAFQQPARSVMISDLVGEKHLLNAISLNAAAHNASRGVGPAIAGLVINAFGVGISYFIQAAIYLMATVWTVQIKLPATLPHAGPAEVEKQDFLRSALEGLSHITTHRMVLAVMVLGLAPAVLG